MYYQFLFDCPAPIRRPLKKFGGYCPTNDLSAENHCAAMLFDDHSIRKAIPSKLQIKGNL
jgi:hypothetical protein